MENKIYISASVMCANLLNLMEDIQQMQANHVDYLHLDVMDGHFVDNIALGIDCCLRLKKAGIPRDIHLLVNHPELFVERLSLAADEILQVHYESKADFYQISNDVHRKKAKFGIVLNPETSVEVLTPFLPCIDIVSLMMIKPGFPGRKMEAGMIQKVSDTRNWLDKNGVQHIPIEVDGNINIENAPQLYKKGAVIFVAGTSSIFQESVTLSEGIKRLRNSILHEGTEG